MGRHQFPHPFEEGVFSGGILAGKIERQLFLVEFLLEIRMPEKRLDLAGEQEHVPVAVIVERLDPVVIPRREQGLRFRIPDDVGEHPAQIPDELGSVLLVSVQQHFAVRVGPELVSFFQKSLPEFTVVVDLPVEDQDERPVFVEQRLIAADQVDDGKTPVSERDAVRAEESFSVRAAMPDGVRHPADQRFFLRFRTGPRKSCDSAHNSAPLFLNLSRRTSCVRRSPPRRAVRTAAWRRSFPPPRSA